VSAAEQVTTQQLTAAEAEQLLDTVTRQAEQLDAGLGRLYHGGAAEALGFGTGAAGWAALCRDRLRHLEWLSIKPGPRRLEKVAELRRQQLSARAIGDAMGLSAATVSGELAKLRDAGVDLPTNVVSLDGRRRPARAAERAQEAPAAPVRPDGLTDLMWAALEHLAAAGDRGLSCLELERVAGWREGRCTSLLFRLRAAGLAARPGERRDGYAVHVATLPAT
jgi:DNA-binding transcriptional ArsR family regulator